MSCLNKFHSHLHLDRLDFVPTTLVVGSFNPAWPAENSAEWFYGRTASNYFWDVLPRLYAEESLINATPAEWKQFCANKQIAFTDLISSIDDADPNDAEHNKIIGGFSDKAIEYNFEDFVYVNIVQLLQRYPSITNVYLTRSITDAFWRHLWNPVVHYCNHNNIRAQLLLSPSQDARFHHEMYNSNHPEQTIVLLKDYIRMRWQQEWHYK